jgi:hypothetical protein
MPVSMGQKSSPALVDGLQIRTVCGNKTDFPCCWNEFIFCYFINMEVYQAVFSSRTKKFRDTIALLLVCGNYCPTID